LRVRVLSQLFLLEGKKVATEIKTAALGQQVRARVAAIRMLGKLKGDKEAAELLLRFLDEADERVRIAASLTFLGG
jgi:HEAT repeat protein